MGKILFCRFLWTSSTFHSKMETDCLLQWFSSHCRCLKADSQGKQYCTSFDQILPSFERADVLTRLMFWHIFVTVGDSEIWEKYFLDLTWMSTPHQKLSSVIYAVNFNCLLPLQLTVFPGSKPFCGRYSGTACSFYPWAAFHGYFYMAMHATWMKYQRHAYQLLWRLQICLLGLTER